MILISLNEASLTVLFTSFNGVEVNLLIQRIIEHDDENAQASKKLTKACIFVIVNY